MKLALGLGNRWMLLYGSVGRWFETEWHNAKTNGMQYFYRVV